MATETMAVVFTDMVGSTAQRARLGDRAADALLLEHEQIVRRAADRHAARVVKGTGDGAMIAFGSAADAVHAAVAIQQSIEQRNRRAGERIGLRVGISLGDLAADGGDLHGLAAHEAARICELGGTGTVLVSDVVRVVAGSRLEPALVEHGRHELRGIAGPVMVWSVVWVPSEVLDERPGLPARLVSVRSSNFVGRDTERAHLVSAWKAVMSGDRRVMLLAGEPGIGKTALAAQFASDAYDEGAFVVYGRSDEDLGLPHQPWIEALTQLVVSASESVLAAHLADRGAHLGRLVPDLARRMGTEVPERGEADTERFVVYGCVSDLLARVSQDRPLLVVLDDLQWADRASVHLLRHLATSDTPMRVGVLGTFRDSEIDAHHPVAELLASLHREGCVDRIRLPGLGDNDLLALLEEIAGHAMDEQGVALRDALLAETAGNPFFVGEILRHLADTGAIYQRDDGHWVADADLRAVGLPVSVREVIGRRLAGLGADSERVLALAAVIGRDFDIPLLAAVARTDEDTMLDLCDAAVAAAVLQTTGTPDRYTFAHALIEHTLYDSLSPSRRARAHKAIAEHLETLDPDDRAGELAYHWAQAVQPTDLEKAVRYAKIAADRALDHLAPDEAVRWYTQALDLAQRMPGPDERQRAELLVGLGDAQRQCGVAAHRETLLEVAHLADSIDAVDLLVRAAISNNRGFASTIGLTDHERIAVIDRALDRLGDADPANRARLLTLGSSERTYDAPLEQRVALAEQAVVVARASGDRAALLFTLSRSMTSITAPSTVALRKAWTDEACAIADEVGDGVLRYWAHDGGQMVALDRGDRRGYLHHLALMELEAQRVPTASTRWNLALAQVSLALLGGDMAEAERLAERALIVGGEAEEPDALTLFGAQLAALRLHQGRFGELVPLAEVAFADAPELKAYRAGLTLMKFYAGAHDEARQMFTDDLTAGLWLPVDDAWAVGHACWSEVAFRLKAAEAAPLLRSRIVPYHDQIITTSGISVYPGFAYYLGLLDHLAGRLDEADAWFRESIKLHEQLESPLLMAYTQAAWASLLADRAHDADSEQARTMAGEALSVATAKGYGYIEADARSVLDRLT